MDVTHRKSLLSRLTKISNATTTCGACGSSRTGVLTAYSISIRQLHVAYKLSEFRWARQVPPIRLPETSSIYRSALTLMRSLQELKRARYICTVQFAIIQSLNFRPFLEYTFRLFFGQTTRPTNPEVLTCLSVRWGSRQQESAASEIIHFHLSFRQPGTRSHTHTHAPH